MLFFILLSQWRPPIQISHADSYSNFSSLCVDKRGLLHAVWEDKRSGKYQIYYNYKDGSGWHTEVNISNSSYSCESPSVAVDTLNRVHVVWEERVTGRIKWSMYNGSSWSTPVSISNDVPYPSICPEIKLNHLDNTIHCVWHDYSAGEIWYKRFDGENWGSVENVSNDQAGSAYPDIAIDRLGRVHVVWGDWSTYDVFYRIKENGVWGSIKRLQPYTPSSQSCDPRIAVDMNNNPHIVWEERAGIGYIYYTYFDGSNWVFVCADSGERVAGPVIAIDIYNRAHIVDGDLTYDIYWFLFRDTIMISGPENISNEPYNSILPEIEVDNDSVYVIWSQLMGPASPWTNGEIFYSSRELPSGIEDTIPIEKWKISQSIVLDVFSFSFSLEKSSYVRLEVYNTIGRKVKSFSLGRMEKGEYRENIRLEIPSGIYFIIIEVDDKKKIGKIIKIGG